MPTYAMTCSTCEACYEVTRSIHKGPPKKCRECGEKDQDKFGQDYSQTNPLLWNYDIRCVGQLSNQNAKRLGKEKMQALENRAKFPREVLRKETGQDGRTIKRTRRN